MVKEPWSSFRRHELGESCGIDMDEVVIELTSYIYGTWVCHYASVQTATWRLMSQPRLRQSQDRYISSMLFWL